MPFLSFFVELAGVASASLPLLALLARFVYVRFCLAGLGVVVLKEEDITVVLVLLMLLM